VPNDFYFQREVQLFRFSAYPDPSPSNLIRMNAVVFYSIYGKTFIHLLILCAWEISFPNLCLHEPAWIIYDDDGNDDNRSNLDNVL